MNRSSLSRLVWASLLVLVYPLSADVIGFQKVAIIRVTFQKDLSPGTTGDGSFLLSEITSPCGKYTIDPPPHDKAYFQSQLKAVDHYFRAVSYNQFGIDLDNSRIFPADSLSAYELDHPMSYYHPLGAENQYEQLITELFTSAVKQAVEDNVDLSTFNQVIVIHAGVGQDFNLPFLDPTPEDIQSTFIDETMFNTYLGGPIDLGNGELTKGIVLPETQNHLLFDETLFSEMESPCDAQYGLTGTLALMLGFSAGLPPLWDTESGRSGIGIFGLMDQGSNNGRGLIPAPPDAWTRKFAGWENPQTIQTESHISILDRQKNSVIKIPINDSEYFLVENRVNWFRQGVNIDSVRYLIWENTGVYPPFVEILIDSTTVVADDNGVIVSVPDYDLGLPASGLLIWHVDETRIDQSISHYAINQASDFMGIDLEEADGAQDLGYVSQLIPDPSGGYFGDMWFKNNREYERANPQMQGQAPLFGPFTFPDTRSNSGASSLVSIQNISKPGEQMTFDITFDRPIFRMEDPTQHLLFQFDFDGDKSGEIFGFGDSLWWTKNDLDNRENFYPNRWSEFQLCFSEKDDRSQQHPASLVIAGTTGDSLVIVWFNYDSSVENFVPGWQQQLLSVCDPGYIHVQDDPQKVDLFWAGKTISINSDTVIQAVSDPALLCDDFPETLRSDGDKGFQASLDSITITTTDGYSFKGFFTDLALIDLDNDGRVDILTLDTEGKVYAFDRQLRLKSGFPVNVNAEPPLLAKNIRGDAYPEIVFQN
ncbi:MAG: hypothetical protein ACE5D2_02680, partial [Fidelibacterota bacterium]